MEGQLQHPVSGDDAEVVVESEPMLMSGSEPMMRWEPPPQHLVSGDDAEVVEELEPMMRWFGSEPMMRWQPPPQHLVSGDEVAKKKPMIRVLPEMSGVNEQCIYVVPRKVRKVNPEAYTPQVVSIGPFHNPHRSGGGDNFLKPMGELKLKYLEGFLNRTRLCAEDICLKLKEWENRIQSCYEELVISNSNDFLNMILIDACFIIEYFLRCLESEKWKDRDPILLKPWLEIDIKRDLILLENQLPFFVLEVIYNLTDMNIPSFLRLLSTTLKMTRFRT